MRYIVLAFFLLFFYGCGSDTDEKVPTEPTETNTTEPTETNTTEPTETNTTEPTETNTTEPEPEPEPSLPLATQNPLFYQQWAIHYDAEFYAQNRISSDAHINPQDLLQRYSGKTIRVAVIDDGFDVNHPDLKENIIITKSVLTDAQVVSDVSHTNDTDHHGTSVAGIIGAKNNTIGIMGLASNVELILIKIPMDYSSDAANIKAFDLAEFYGADIINCSWGTGEISDGLRAKIADLANNGRNGKGTLVVFASGNNNTLMLNDESSIEEVFGVGATDREGLRTLYSDFGPDLDLSAPGGDLLGITTLDPLGSDGSSADGYIRFDQFTDGVESYFIGTSAAAPIVSAALALALEADPDLTRTQLFEHLQYTSKRVGQNVPYLHDMVRSSSNTPLITGTLASSEFSDFSVRLLSYANGLSYGPYSISSLGSNEWGAFVTDSLAEGEYMIEVFAKESETSDIIFATDQSFIIDNELNTYTDKELQRNDFYGYGKLDLSELIERILK